MRVKKIFGEAAKEVRKSGSFQQLAPNRRSVATTQPHNMSLREYLSGAGLSHFLSKFKGLMAPRMRASVIEAQSKASPIRSSSRP